MAATKLESNKAKIAKRVIEVFEFFGGTRQPPTVMDIARHFGRPQSSTSELLSSLVEIGLLYNYMDRLAQTTRKTVALFGIVGTHIQVFRWISSARPLARDIGCGSSEPLSNSMAGLLLLSMLPLEQARGTLWRLNAEAAPEDKFDHAEMVERVTALRRKGHATGESGFIESAHVSAILLPPEIDDRPLALGVLYPAEGVREADALIETMRHGIGQIVGDRGAEYAAAPSAPIGFIRAV